MIAQDSPVQGWLSGWVDFMQGAVKSIFIVVVMILITIILVRRGHVVRARLRAVHEGRVVHESHWVRRVPGGLRAAIGFGLGAALLLLLLTRTADLADLFRGELPIGGD